jgi:hypothetical protein
MYRIIFSVILIAFLGDVTLVGEEKVFGGYRKCTSYLYEYKDGIIDIESKRMSETFVYDEQGKKVDYMHFNTDKPSDTYCCKNPSRGTEYELALDLETGKEFIKKSYKYNKVNNLVEKIEFDSKGSIIEVITYKYDTKCREIEQVVYGGNSILKEKITTKYRTKKDKSINNDTNISADSTMENKSQLNNDTYRNYVDRRIRKYDETGTMIQTIVQKYDEFEFEKSNTDEMQKSSSGKTRSGGLDKTTYELDEKERVIAVLHYNSKKVVEEKCAYKYDKFGNTIEKIYYKLGIPIFKTEFIYSK